MDFISRRHARACCRGTGNFSTIPHPGRNRARGSASVLRWPLPGTVAQAQVELRELAAFYAEVAPACPAAKAVEQ